MQTDQPTDRQTDIRAHREVSLPTIEIIIEKINAENINITDKQNFL